MNNKNILTAKKMIIAVFLLISTSMFGVAIYTSPNPAITEIGAQFVISINLDDIVDIRGYVVIMEYDANLLEFDQAEKGNLFDGQPIGWWIVDNETPGMIQVDCLIFGAGIFVTGPGNILDLTFTALSEGVTSLTFIETVLSDPVGEIIPDVTSINGYVIIGDQVPPTPLNLTINIVETTLTLSWEEIQCCTYNVYSTNSLEDRLEWHLEVENLTQNNWSCSLQQNENHKFYYITAEFNINQQE